MGINTLAQIPFHSIRCYAIRIHSIWFDTINIKLITKNMQTIFIFYYRLFRFAPHTLKCHVTIIYQIKWDCTCIAKLCESYTSLRSLRVLPLALTIANCQSANEFNLFPFQFFFSLNFSSSCLSLSLIRSCMWKRQSLQYSICSNFESIECTLANHYRRLFWNAFRAQINLDLVGQWKHSMQNHSSTSNIIDR